MKKISNTRNITILTMKENVLYQIKSKHAYIRKNNSQVYIYSYDTCILQLDYNTKTIYNNTLKYSITTSKQKTEILRDLYQDLIGWYTIDVTPTHDRDLCGQINLSLGRLV